MEQKKIDELKAMHPHLTLVTVDGSELVFRAPTRMEFDRYIDADKTGKLSAVARELAQSTLVYPTRDEMVAALERRPGALISKGGILDSICDLAGFTEDGVTSKKL